MPKLSNYLLRFIYLTVPGFIYLIGAFYLLQAFTDNYLMDVMVRNKEYNFYLGILVVIFSFIIGFIMHLAEQKILHWIFPKFKKPADFLFGMSDVQKQSWDDVSAILVLIRHLIISTVFLGCALYTWFALIKKIDLLVLFLVTFLIILGVLTLAYLKEREMIVQWRAEAKKQKKQ
jgi:hypothetical protein